jgi:hypothetical protein
LLIGIAPIFCDQDLLDAQKCFSYTPSTGESSYQKENQLACMADRYKISNDIQDMLSLGSDATHSHMEKSFSSEAN